MNFLLKEQQKIWILRKGKPEEWRIVDLDYEWHGFKYIKLKKDKDYIFATSEQCFLHKHDCK